MGLGTKASGSALVPAPGEEVQVIPAVSPVSTDAEFEAFRDTTKELKYDLFDHLPGPLMHGKSWDEKKAAIREFQNNVHTGSVHALHTSYQIKYGDQGLASNIVVPKISR